MNDIAFPVESTEAVYTRRSVAIDIEIIPDPKAKPYIPEKGPKDRTEPWEKLIFDSNFNMICCVGFCDGSDCWSIGLDDFSTDIACDAERMMLDAFWRVTLAYDRYITFNGNSFDIPFIVKRSWYHGIQPPLTISLQRYTTASNHLDLRALLSNWDNYARGSLDLYGALKLGKRKTEGISGDKVAGLWASGECKQVREYCEQDTRLTYELYQSMRGFYFKD